MYNLLRLGNLLSRLGHAVLLKEELDEEQAVNRDEDVRNDELNRVLTVEVSVLSTIGGNDVVKVSSR